MNKNRRMLIASLLYMGSGLPAIAGQMVYSPGEMLRKLAGERDRFALLYFVQQGCQYCAKENPILAQFQKHTGWYIKQIDIHQEPEVNTKFNISNTPTIILIAEGMDSRSWQPVSYGFSEADMLLKSIYGITRVLRGESSPQLLDSFLIHGQSTSFAGAQQ